MSVGSGVRLAARSDRARRSARSSDADEAGDALEDLPGAQPGHRHQPVGDDGAADRRAVVDEGEHGRRVDGWRDGEREGVGRAQRLEEVAGLDGAGDVGGDLVVVAGDGEAGAGDRCERRRARRRRRRARGRRAGTSRRRRGTRGRRATTSPVCRSHRPVRPARLISACSSPPSERTTHSATLSQRTPSPRRSRLGQLEDRGDRVEAARRCASTRSGSSLAISSTSPRWSYQAMIGAAGCPWRSSSTPDSPTPVTPEADDAVVAAALVEGAGDHRRGPCRSRPSRPSRRGGRRPPTASPPPAAASSAPARSTTTALTRVEPTSTPTSTSSAHRPVSTSRSSGSGASAPAAGRPRR